MGIETNLRTSSRTATSAMIEDTPPTFSLPAVSRKKVTAAFDGGRLSSDSGVMLLALAERRRTLASTLAALISDPRDPAHITHTVEDVLRARMLAIACGYEDGRAQTINRQRVNGVPALNQSADGDPRGRRSLFSSIRRSMAGADA